MIPIKLSLSGFLSYREPVEVDFTRFELACISGPNGAGKSALLDGITWALFGQARRRDEAIINTRATTAEVELIFSYEDNIYRVQRVNAQGKSMALEFHIATGEDRWKALTERTRRGTDALIQQTLRMDYETFVNASFFLQGKADQFTQQRPGDRKRILSNILGLEIWESYRRQSVERRKLLENQIAELDGRLQEINNELAQENQRLARLQALETNLQTISASLNTQKATLEALQQNAAALAEQEKLVNNLAEQSTRSRHSLEILEQRLTVRRADQQQHSDILGRADQIEKDYQAWQQARTELERWDETSSRFNEQEKARHAPLTEIGMARTRLEAKHSELLKQRAAVEQAESERTDLDAQQKELQTRLAELEKALAERTALEEKLQTAIQEQADARAENPVLREKMVELQDQIKQLNDTDEATCPLCGQPLPADDRQRLIEEKQAKGTESGDKYRANQALLKNADQQVTELESQQAGLTEFDEEQRELTRRLDQLTTHYEIINEQAAVWQSESEPRLQALEAELAAENYAPEARTALAEIDAELKETGYDAAQHDAIRKRETGLRATETELRQLENARAALAPLDREIEELEAQIKETGEVLGQQDGQHQDAAANLAAAQTQAPDVRSAERNMLNLQQQENQIRMEVGAAQQEVLVLDTQRQRRKALEAEREGFAQTVSQYKSLERAFGKDGVPAILIEQALPQIENKANQLLERLSGGNMSVRFITQQAYKDKTREDLRETLEIQISDSAGMRDYEMFSGGEAFRINFAIRLALSEVLTQRAGARLQTLVIDEGFGSQDEIGRQRLIEAINLVKDDFEKILVITHIESLKDAFPTRIEVEKTERGSVVNLI